MKNEFAIFVLSCALLLASNEAFAQDAAAVAEHAKALEEAKAILRDTENKVQSRGRIRPRVATPPEPDPAINIANENLRLVRRPKQAAVPATQQSQLQQFGIMIAQGVPTALLQSNWRAFVADLKAAETPIDTNSLVQDVLNEAYLQITNDLRFRADKVRFYNNIKKQLQAQIRAARGQLNPSHSSAGLTTDEELEAYIRNLGELLADVEVSAQLANVDLQNALQRQQQILQMMSNIAKLLHDTAMSIVRKVGS